MNICCFLTLILCLLRCGAYSYSVSADLCRSAYWWCRQPAYSQQWKGPISNPMASRHCHLIHPRGEKSIQILKLAGGCYPWWRACMCLFRKEQNRVKKKSERDCCLLWYPLRNHSNWATGHWGKLLCVCQHWWDCDQSAVWINPTFRQWTTQTLQRESMT